MLLKIGKSVMQTDQKILLRGQFIEETNIFFGKTKAWKKLDDVYLL